MTKKDIIWSYIGTAFSMASNLLLLPFLVRLLDADMLGMWYVFASVGSISTLFDFGFSVTFARNITYCWSGARTLEKEDVVFVNESEPDYNMMNQVLVTCKVLYGILAGVALLLLFSVGTIYISYIGRDLPGNTHIISWFVYAFAAFLNLYYGYYASFLRGVGAVDRVNKNTVIARLVHVGLTISLLFLGMGIIGASIAYLAYGIIFRLLGKKYFYSYKNLGEQLKQKSQKVTFLQIRYLLNIVWHNAWRDGMISICSYLSNHASTMICSMYLPLATTGIYSIGVQMATAISQIAGSLYNAYQPEIQSAYINQDQVKVRKIMSLIVMSYIYLFIMGTVGACIVGIPLLRMIRPTAAVPVSVLLGLCVYQFILKYRNCYTSYFSCTNRIIYMNGFIVSSVICVGLSFVALAVFDLGMWGLIGAQIVSQIIYNAWKWPILAHKEMKVSAVEIIYGGTNEVAHILKNFRNRLSATFTQDK